jgi:DNA-nicking Smr family endonuclease
MTSGDDDDDFVPPEVVELPITDTLDLHTFHPRDVKALVTDYLEAAHEQGLRELRIVHGKGVGVLREIVHKVCARHPRVASFRLADGAGGGGWGATLVTLKE